MKLIVANWKLNPPTLKEAQNIIRGISKTKARTKVVICPPSVYLGLLKTKFDLGAQDIFWEQTGAYTGEVSASMLRQFKVKYAIIGHSERRAIGESDQQISKKVAAAIAQKIIPILCVGYGIAAGHSDDEVMSQLQPQIKASLGSNDPTKVIIAYEPVWAIGSGKAATPDHAEKVAMFIKIKFKFKKVLYGGSSNAGNAHDFLRKNIDGLLVGGASLKAEQFVEMIK